MARIKSVYGYIPTMQPGDILGHEFMGEVVEGAVNQVTKLPTSPQPQEDPDGLFDPQRDISPG